MEYCIEIKSSIKSISLHWPMENSKNSYPSGREKSYAFEMFLDSLPSAIKYFCTASNSKLF